MKIQTFTSSQQLCRVQPDRLSQQAFTCCGGQFQLFPHDPEGYAVSEPYNACDPNNLLLLINHTLLLSTQFTSSAVFGPPCGSYHRRKLLTEHQLVGLRGRRTIVYQVESEDGYRVKKISWPTIHQDTTQEIRIYKVLKRADKSKLQNITQMVEYDRTTSTAEIRRIFGCQSITLREWVQLVVDRYGESLDVFLHNWELHCKELGPLRAFHRLMKAVHAGILGNQVPYYLNFFNVDCFSRSKSIT